VLRGIALLAGVLCGSAVGADVTVVHAGHVLDVEHGKMLDDQGIWIDNGKITRIGKFDPSHAANAIDWSAYTVVPGLIDLHTHLIGDLDSSNVAAPLMSSAARDTLLGVKHARDTVRAGFTTVRDVGVYRAYTDVALRDAINNGSVEGPRMFVAGAYITVSRGGGEVNATTPDVLVPDEMRRGVADSADEVRQRVREILSNGADLIKVIATGAVLANGTEPGAPEFSEAEIRAAVDEAKLRGVFVAAHAHGAEGIKRAVRAGVRTIEHASYLDDEGIALMKQRGTWLVADIYNGDYIDVVGHREHWPEEILRKNTETTQTQRDGFSKAVKAGVNIAFGTDAGVYPHGDNARQLAYMVKYGMTPAQAIRAATLDSARALGHEKEFGSISVGKSADLVAVAGDPLSDVRVLEHVKGVIKQGAMICAAALSPQPSALAAQPACREITP
jgi:imidazolonepropionase-like amidohydrolase